MVGTAPVASFVHPQSSSAHPVMHRASAVAAETKQHLQSIPGTLQKGFGLRPAPSVLKIACVEVRRLTILYHDLHRKSKPQSRLHASSYYSHSKWTVCCFFCG
ncbi:uncharacterized protein PV09_02981 [Verruconis gallopava]|uniref:Uncharacterized protein n=1 Tax=Verruconis gallopava TaxID=253628 RepID=A0A0D1XUW8_9PEZI|nr:uncharacterized protein PV09_02981 [Verruconis gallopava]KIW06551.1 hypothetical protein PV09_02981 [Verruconis gallopava]